MTAEFEFLIDLNDGKEYDEDKDENDGKEFILLYRAPGVDLLAAVSSESKTFVFTTNQPTPRTTPSFDGIISIPCFHHSSCVVSFAIWFSNVRFSLEVHCMRIA